MCDKEEGKKKSFDVESSWMSKDPSANISISKSCLMRSSDDLE